MPPPRKRSEEEMRVILKRAETEPIAALARELNICRARLIYLLARETDIPTGKTYKKKRRKSAGL
jgi:hypothetical protein